MADFSIWNWLDLAARKISLGETEIVVMSEYFRWLVGFWSPQNRVCVCRVGRGGGCDAVIRGGNNLRTKAMAEEWRGAEEDRAAWVHT